MADYRKSKAHCPKCNSKDLTIIEHCVNLQTWEQINGIINHEEGYMNPDGVIGTYGQCTKCEHKWKFRSLQITGLYLS